MYATYSPLNWFTKRRRMKVKVRKPVIDSQVSLYNSSGIGLLTLCDNNQTIEASVIKADTGEQIEFTKE